MCFPDEKYVESSSYHEAGHTVTAVALGMPLRKRGVHIDRRGDGISYYWFREPGDTNKESEDIAWRERTIISIEAGFAAQRRFYPDCPTGGNFTDRDQCIKLLNEMHANSTDWFVAQKRLIAEARRLVDRHWEAIEALARAVLAQPLTSRPEEKERHWSGDSVERWIDGNQVVSILKQFGPVPSIHDEADGKFHPKGLRPGSMTTAGEEP
jgi:hypothetical protein